MEHKTQILFEDQQNRHVYNMLRSWEKVWKSKRWNKSSCIAFNAIGSVPIKFRWKYSITMMVVLYTADGIYLKSMAAEINLR